MRCRRRFEAIESVWAAAGAGALVRAHTAPSDTIVAWRNRLEIREVAVTGQTSRSPNGSHWLTGSSARSPCQKSRIYLGTRDRSGTRLLHAGGADGEAYAIGGRNGGWMVELRSRCMRMMTEASCTTVATPNPSATATPPK